MQKIYSLINLPVRQKLLLFLSIAILGSVAIPLAAKFMSAPIYPLIALFVLAILTPLAVSFFVYKRRGAKFFAGLTAIAILLGVAAVISGTILSQHFIAECESHGPDRRVLFTDYGADCLAPHESDTYTSYDLLGPLGLAGFYFFLFSSLFNLANLIYLPFWYLWQATRNRKER